MKATIRQAEENEKNLSIRKTGYGHWRIECDYKNSRIHTTTTNSMAVDDFNSEFGEKDQYRVNRRKQGYEQLCRQIIYDNTGK